MRLSRIGWHRPAAIAHYVGFEVAKRARRPLLRSLYRFVVARSRASDISPPRVRIPPYAELPERLKPAAEAVREYAEETLAHRFDLLGSGPVELGESIDWHRDFKSGYVWPVDVYTRIVATRLDDNSDAKVPWELSRGHHLVGLARAAVMFREQRYAQELERQLDHWLRANPPGYGINWVNTMETAIRAVNWIWALGTLEQWRPLDSALRERVVRSLGVHGRHIMANLEGTPFLRSNHYTADVLGLMVLGHCLRGDASRLRWRLYATRAFRREARRQILDDGVGFEASLPYHCLVLEMFLVAAHAARSADKPLDVATEARIAAMAEAVRALRHPGGRVPQFGDCDSGRILPAGPERGPTRDYLLWLAAGALDGPAPLPGIPSAEVAWTLGVDTWSNLAERPAAKPPTRRAFRDGGLYILGSEWMHLVARCGDVGQNGNGGHAHNDLLTFELSCGGSPLVVDSGTFVYTSDPSARDAFRCTRAHNVLQVAGEEFNPIEPGHLFELSQVAKPRVLSFDPGPGHPRLRATHDAWHRLSPPVEHMREWVLEGERTLVIRDHITGLGNQLVTVFTHLAPDVTVVPAPTAGGFVLQSATQNVALQFTGPWRSVQVIDGLVSNRFGISEPSSVIVAQARVGDAQVLGHTFADPGSPPGPGAVTDLVEEPSVDP